MYDFPKVELRIGRKNGNAAFNIVILFFAIIFYLIFYYFNIKIGKEISV